MTLKLHNSLTRQKEEFVPVDASNVRMYVCGPTVYDLPHIGNARAVVVYDVLFRLLQHLYGKEHVTYVRNITDVDDKIIVAAKENGEPIEVLTKRITQGFHDDMEALHNLPPTHEPKATEHIGEMITMIEQLISGGHAYEAEGHVLFDVTSMPEYGQLSGKKLDDLIAGARVEVESYKKNSGDFVLWKPAEEGDDPSAVFDSPWGQGRPGWHIECSAMSTKYLGENFDIHGGGADLKFPHHENEIAQSCCANAGSQFAKYWVHNGFLTVEGEKMAKSEGNFITVRDLLDRGVKGEIIRYVLLSTKYNEPLDWSEQRLEEAKKALDGFYRLAGDADSGEVPEDFITALADDLNTPKAFAVLHETKSPEAAKAMADFLGLLQEPADSWFGKGEDPEVEAQINARNQARDAKDWAEADRIRDALEEQGILLEDRPDGTTDWRRA